MTDPTPNPGAAAIEAARSVNIRRGDAGRGRPADGTTTEQAAEQAGVSPKSVARARALLDSGNLQLIQDVERKELSLSAAYVQLHAAPETPDDSPSLVPPKEQPSMLTPETLRPVLTDACQRLDEWRQADFPTKGTLDQPIREKFTELAELLNTDSVHPDCWQLTLAGDELVSQFGQWIDSVGGMDPIVIDAAAEVEKASTHEPREEERLESLEDILLRGRSHSDAARAWRWFAIDQDGKVVPDVARVAVALAYPSAPRVPGPNPRVIRQQLELEARWEARRRSRASAQPRKCPETLEQLLEQGVSFKQITKMTGKTPDEITAVAIELGHLADPDRPKSRFAPPPEVLLDRIDSHQELGSDLRARVLAMAADGHSPGTIVQVCHRNGFREASLRLLEAWLKPKVEAQA